MEAFFFSRFFTTTSLKTIIIKNFSTSGIIMKTEKCPESLIKIKDFDQKQMLL